MYAAAAQVVKRFPRMQEIKVRSPVATDRRRKTDSDISTA